MREVGRKGGRVSPQTRLRKEADDSLRAKARAVLERALAGEDVPKSALDSARSLFSYRADQAPRTEQPRGENAPKVVGLVDVAEVACQTKLFSSAGVDPAAEAAFLEALRARRPAGEVDDAAHLRTHSPRKDFRRSRDRGSPPAPATNEQSAAPPLSLSEMAADAPGDFDENPEAVLRRRYGDDRAAGYRW